MRNKNKNNLKKRINAVNIKKQSKSNLIKNNKKLMFNFNNIHNKFKQ